MKKNGADALLYSFRSPESQQIRGLWDYLMSILYAAFHWVRLRHEDADPGAVIIPESYPH
jgi:hypothetical protein